MKCTNCGHELEPGSGFCENCGMIMSLDNNDQSPESVNNAPKMQEDSFDYIENIPAEQNNPQEPAGQPEVSYDSLEEPQEELEPVYEDITSGEPVKTDDEAETEQDNNVYSNAAESDASVFENEASSQQPEENPENEEASVQEDNIQQQQDDDGLDEMLITKTKSKKGGIAVAVLIVVLVAVVAGAVTVIKGNFNVPVAGSAKNTSAQTTEQNDASEPETTKEEPTTKKEKETTEKETKETTEKETTDKETTTKKETTTEKETTTQKASAAAAVTSSVSTTQATSAATSNYSTTRPTTASTTKATTKPQTTAPTTTKPASDTTKPSGTTDKYGISDAVVKKPTSYLKNSYTAYITAEGVHMRSGPSKDSEHVLYLSKGADVKVLASQNGFYYIYSNRYGVYGWVSASYASKTRPQTNAETTVPNLVAPDKTYSSPATKYVNASKSLRLRKGPGSSYDVIKLIPNGYPVKVKGYSESAPGWVYVTDTTYGVSGWVSSAYLK
ncbi:MAG: SH3 domain-containing protein [Acutalibacteraceae bacterium]